MKNIYEDLNAKIAEKLAKDPVYTDLNEQAESLKSIFDEVAKIAPDIRAGYESDEEFVKYMCSGTASQYFDEEIDDDIYKWEDRARKHRLFHEEEEANKAKRRMEELKVEKQQLAAFLSDRELGRRASKAVGAVEKLHGQMVERLHVVTRETIKEQYYTPSVQQIFKAAEKKVDVEEHDRLEVVIDQEVKKFIAAREYQIPPRSTTLRK